MKWVKRMHPEPHVFSEETNDVICFCETEDGDLLSAAPELLEACKLLLSYALEENGPRCQGAQEAIRAIAKAEGLIT